jgi:hypothetical protein
MHTELLALLRRIDRGRPKGKTLHLIADGYTTHQVCSTVSARMDRTRRTTASRLRINGDDWQQWVGRVTLPVRAAVIRSAESR